jgi:uncharacterized membrane protein
MKEKWKKVFIILIIFVIASPTITYSWIWSETEKCDKKDYVEDIRERYCSWNNILKERRKKVHDFVFYTFEGCKEKVSWKENVEIENCAKYSNYTKQNYVEYCSETHELRGAWYEIRGKCANSSCARVRERVDISLGKNC